MAKRTKCQTKFLLQNLSNSSQNNIKSKKLVPPYHALSNIRVDDDQGHLGRSLFPRYAPLWNVCLQVACLEGKEKGTTMMDMMVISDLAFREIRLQYPMTFLVFCVGYAAAMMMDILLARAVSKRLQDAFNLKSLDGFMFGLVHDLEPTKYYDVLETKKSSGIGYLQCVMLDRLKVLVDCSFLLYIFSFLSMYRGVDIGGADTKTMAWRAFLNATSYNIIYAASMAITVQSLDQCTPLIGRGFIVFISLAGSAGVMLERLCSNYEIISDTGPNGLGDKAGAWVVGLLLGFIGAVLVHLSVHHLLVDGNKARSCKVVAVIIGVGVIALLKVLEI